MARRAFYFFYEACAPTLFTMKVVGGGFRSGEYPISSFMVLGGIVKFSVAEPQSNFLSFRDRRGGSMKLVTKCLLFLILPLPFKTGAVSAQEKLNIAELVLAVRQGIADAQQREVELKLTPMFLVKDFEMTISFVVEKSATGGFDIKVVTLGGDVKQGTTHTVTIRSETAAYEHVKARVQTCLEKQPDSTYPSCLKQAYKKLGISPIHR